MDDRRRGRLVLILKRNGYTPSEIEEGVSIPIAEQDVLEKVYRDSLPQNINRHLSPPERERIIGESAIRWANENGRFPRAEERRLWNGLPGGHAWNEWNYRRGTRWGGTYADPWAYLVKNIKKVKPNVVLTIQNQTILRDAIQQYGGFQKILENGGGEFVQKDDYGTLWKTPLLERTDDEYALWLEVVNSTAKVDENLKPVLKKGKPVYDHYFLRVPPDTRTAKDAVAWTGWFEHQPDRLRANTYKNSAFKGFVQQS